MDYADQPHIGLNRDRVAIQRCIVLWFCLYCNSSCEIIKVTQALDASHLLFMHLFFFKSWNISALRDTCVTGVAPAKWPRFKPTVAMDKQAALSPVTQPVRPSVQVKALHNHALQTTSRDPPHLLLVQHLLLQLLRQLALLVDLVILPGQKTILVIAHSLTQMSTGSRSRTDFSINDVIE